MTDADKQRILVVEDVSVVQVMLAGCLRTAGYWIATASSAGEARSMLDKGDFDLVMLDIELPDGDGLSLLREIKARSTQPVILVSGRDRPEQRAQGLDLGADDYVPKPVYPPELLARVKNVLARNPAAIPIARRTRFDRWVIDAEARMVTTECGAPIKLTKAEFDLLHHLVQRPGRLLARENLAWLLGTDHPDTDLRSIDTLVSRIRRKLGAERNAVIETCRGLGYRFIAQVEAG